MSTLRTANTEPIPGYRLLAPLGRGGFGEVWKCEAPGGLHKAIKFVHGADGSLAGRNGAEQELRALQHIKGIRHSFLLSIERVELVEGDLILVMELADRSLHDLLREQQAVGRRGIPRAELLRYLGEAAEVLDVMNQEHGLQHLDIKPQNLFLVGRHVKVADFGLVNSLADLAGSSPAAVQQTAVTPVYAAPEVFLGKVTLFSDQYSLAITYQELLTGTLPFTGKNARQLLMQHTTAEPNLSRLPESDRAAVARALAKDARKRFPSCSEFVRALESPSAPESSRSTMADLSLGSLSATPVMPRSALGQPLRAGQTPSPRVAKSSAPDSFLLGYRLAESLGRTPAAEVWKAQRPDGRWCQIKLVLGLDLGESRPEGHPLDRLRSLRHEALAPLEVVCDGTRLALITDPGETTLADLLRDCRRDGQAGLPREEVFNYLRRAAGALDALSLTHRLQHLTLSPRQMVLEDEQLYLTDFGLAELLWLPAGHGPAEVNPRYSAPELFEGQVSRACDQYSLALIFAELLTGVHPFRNLNPRQLGNLWLRTKPDLGLVPATDRPALLRALHPDPDRRFCTCTELVEALDRGDAGSSGPVDWPSANGLGVRPSANGTGSRPSASGVGGRASGSDVGRRPAWPELPVEVPEAVSKSAREVVADLVARAAQDADVRAFGDLRYRLRPGATPALEHQCFARLVPGTTRLKLEGFCEQWRAQPIRRAEDVFTFHVALAGSLWQRCLGSVPGIEVEIRLLPLPTPGSLTPITVTLTPTGYNASRARELLGEVGSELLGSIRTYLQAQSLPELERYPFAGPVGVSLLLDGRPVGEPTVVKAREISRNGLSLELPTAPLTDLCVWLTPPGAREPVAVSTRVLRSQPGADGRHEVDLGFLWAE